MLVTTVAKQYYSALSFFIFIIVPIRCHHASHIMTIDNINVKPSANTVMIFLSLSNQGEKIHPIACHMAPIGTSVFANVSCTRKGRLMHW
jgi:hypothetical protein